jgi:hypothetical protein
VLQLPYTENRQLQEKEEENKRGRNTRNLKREHNSMMWGGEVHAKVKGP